MFTICTHQDAFIPKITTDSRDTLPSVTYIINNAAIRYVSVRLPLAQNLCISEE
jgi:hypothetical protein